MSYYKKIVNALDALGLGDTATLKEIRDAYRRLSFIYHPDRAAKEKASEYKERFTELNLSYQLLIDFCENYNISFREGDIKSNVVHGRDYEHLKKFYDGWLGDIE